MKRLAALLLTLTLLFQLLPAETLAAGDVLTPAQLSEAYLLTGLGRKGRSSGAFHNGMMPASSWNTAMLRDWLDEALDTRMKTVCEVLSHASYTLAQNEENEANVRHDDLVREVRRLQIEAEGLREELRYYRDQLEQKSVVIGEMKRKLEEEADSLFPSDTVRLSWQIQEAADSIKALRSEIVANAREWNKHIKALLDEITGNGESNIGDKLSALFTEEGIIRENHANASRVRPAASRMSRLSGAAGIASDIDVKVTVISEGQVGIVFQTGDPDHPTPVGGDNVKVRVSDVLNPDLPVQEANPDPDTGTVIISVNTFTLDDCDVLHLRLEADPTAAGYRDFVVENLDVEVGEISTFNLVPIGSATAAGPARHSDSADDPYCYMMSFAGMDIMNKEYDMVYSSMNDYALDIRVGVKNPAGKELPQLLLRYYSNQGDIMPEVAYAEPTSVEDDPDQSGGKIYTYTGTWRQTFSPSATSDQRPAFCFGKDDGALTFVSQLVSMQSATDSPINEGTGPDGGIFGNVLGKGFSAGFSLPVADGISISANLNLPYTEYLPHLNISPMGRVVIWMGSPVIDDKINEDPNAWKKQDVREAAQKQTKWEKMTNSVKEKLEKNLGKDAVKNRGVSMFQGGDLDVGWFWVATGRWELDNSIEDIKTTQIKLRSASGIVLTYSYTVSRQTFIPGTPIPAYLSFIFGVSCGFSMEHEIGFLFVNGEFQNWEFLPVSNITIDICFMFAVKAGVGIEGLLDIWVKATASLDFLVNMSITSSDAWSLVVTLGIDLTFGATLIFTSVSVNYNLATIQIYPPESSNLLRHYMGAAGDEPEQQSPTYGEPRSYPALAADTSWMLEPGALGTGTFSRDAKVFYVGSEGNGGLFVLDIQDGDVKWVNTDTGHTGSLSSDMNQIITDHSKGGDLSVFITDDQLTKMNRVLDRTAYDFNVYARDDYVVMTVACAKYYFEDGPDIGLPIPNGNSQLPDDCRDNNVMLYLFVYRRGQTGDATGKLLPGIMAAVGAKSIPTIVFDEHKAPTTDSGTYDSMIAPEIGWALITRINDNRTVRCSFVGSYERISYPSLGEDHKPSGATGFAYQYRFDGRVPKATTNLQIYTDQNVAGGDGNSPARTAFYSVMRPDDLQDADISGNSNNSFSWIAVNGSGSTGTPKNLEFFDWDMNTKSGNGQQAMVLKKNINHYTKYPQLNPDSDPIVVFYSKAERNGFGTARERLHGIRLTKSGDGLVWDMEDNEYDVIIPGGKFDVTMISTLPYIYWFTAAPEQDGDGDTVWQLWTIPYDAPSNTMADPTVLAEFRMPDGYEDWIVRDLVCKGAEECYVTVCNPDSSATENRIGILTFVPMQQPSLQLQGVVLQELAIKSGDFEDASLNVLNDGNLAVTTFDVTMYDVTDGQETETETVHINTIDPSKNWVKLTSEGDTPILTGETAAYRDEDYNMTSRQRNWIVGQDTYEYQVKVTDDGDQISVDSIESSSDPISTELIMPGSDAGFTATFKIPDDWSGTKTLRMRITAVSVDSNIARRIAQLNGRAGADDNELPNPSVTLEYKLDPSSGKLVLDTSSEGTARLLAGGNGGLYARTIDTSAMDLSAEIHDLKVTHRVYRGLDGERWLDMTVRNAAVTGEELKLTCAVYADGSDTPTWLTLPLYPQATSSRMAHTYTMRLSDLVDHPENHRKLRVDLQIVGRDETAYANNEFFILLDSGSSPEPEPPTPVPPTPPVTGDTALPWLNWLLIGFGLLLLTSAWIFVRRRKEGN